MCVIKTGKEMSWIFLQFKRVLNLESLRRVITRVSFLSWPCSARPFWGILLTSRDPLFQHLSQFLVCLFVPLRVGNFLRTETV